MTRGAFLPQGAEEVVVLGRSRLWHVALGDYMLRLIPTMKVRRFLGHGIRLRIFNKWNVQAKPRPPFQIEQLGPLTWQVIALEVTIYTTRKNIAFSKGEGREVGVMQQQCGEYMPSDCRCHRVSPDDSMFE